jgi:hypothetical protein
MFSDFIKEVAMSSNKDLMTLLTEFSEEMADSLIATGIVSNDGNLEAYVTDGARGGSYNVEFSASIFAMMVNVLNNSLCEIYEDIEDVVELTATTQNSTFLFRMIDKGTYFHGVTFTEHAEADQIRQLMEKYETLFALSIK